MLQRFVKHFEVSKGKNPPSINVLREFVYREVLLPCEVVLVDGDGDGFQNNKNTLVFALVDCGDASRSKNSQIHEWIDGYLSLLMTAIAELKPDEFETRHLKGLKGYNRIVRMYWR